MRKGFFAVLIALAVVAVAGATVPTPDTVTVQADMPSVTASAECGADFAAVPAEFDFQAWFEQDAAGVCVDNSADDSALFAKRGGGGGQNCGGTICGAFKYCCNPSCGTCVYYGMSCTQQSCN